MKPAFFLRLRGFRIPVYLVVDLEILGGETGGWSPAKRAIYLDGSLSDDDLKVNLLHEGLHASIDLAGFDDRISHDMVESMGLDLHQMLGEALDLSALIGDERILSDPETA